MTTQKVLTQLANDYQSRIDSCKATIALADKHLSDPHNTVRASILIADKRQAQDLMNIWQTALSGIAKIEITL